MSKKKYLKLPWSVEDTIENLKELKEHLQEQVLIRNLHGMGKKGAAEVAFDFDRAIKALEEVQEYKEIGTVEELQVAMKYVSLAKKHGTIGEVIDACAEYEAIGDIEECKVAVERMKAKKPELGAAIYNGNELIGKDYRCSYCGLGVAEDYMCCPYCRQVLDWEEE